MKVERKTSCTGDSFIDISSQLAISGLLFLLFFTGGSNLFTMQRLENVQTPFNPLCFPKRRGFFSSLQEFIPKKIDHLLSVPVIFMCIRVNRTRVCGPPS